MKKHLSLVILAISLFFISASFAGSQSTNSESYIKIEAKGRVEVDPRRVGDEQRVPVIIVGNEVWSLEFADRNLKKTVRSFAGKNVVVIGLPKIRYHQLMGIEKIIVVQKAKLARGSQKSTNGEYKPHFLFDNSNIK